MSGQAGLQTFAAVCPHDCPDACGMLVTVRDGRVVQVRGDPEHPFTQGFLCGKVAAYPERVHSPQRLLTPLRRAGPKGSGAWQPISWQEALDEIAGRWLAVRERYGGQAILAYVYSGNMGLISRNLPRALFHALGTTQVQTGTICDSAVEAAWDAVYGPCAPLDPEDVQHADLVVAWGADLYTTNVHLVPFVERARRRGARLVCIAPYRHRTARRADWFIPVRVATDGALALAVAHVLFEEGLVDTDFLEQEAEGWQEWAAGVLPRYSPGAVEEITGVPAESVRRLARMLGGARAPFLRVGLALGRHACGGRAVQAVLLLPALVGGWRRRGGGAFVESVHAFSLNYEALRRSQLRPGSLRVVNQALLGQALAELADPPVQAFFVMSSNPAVSCPDAERLRRALLRDDLFTVVHDTFLTETAELADIVLPACTALEHEDLFRSYGQLYMQYVRPAIPPLGQARSNAWLVRELAARLGLDDPVFRRSDEELVQELVQDPQLARRLLAGERVKVTPTGGPGRWPTPSGRIRFDPALDFVPDHARDPELARQRARYPLRLLSAPGYWMHHTSFEPAAGPARRAGPPCCLLHPQEAARRGVRDGELVELFNDRGSVGLAARVTEDVPPGLAVVEGQRSRRAYAFGGPLNVLTGSCLSDLGDGAAFQSTWVDVRPVRAFPAVAVPAG